MSSTSSGEPTKTIAESIAESAGREYEPVTYENCEAVTGPFFHGTKEALGVGEQLVSGYLSNYQDERPSNHVYFAALLEPAVWGAELSVALRGGEGPGHVYIVEPTGPFEDDPNVTNKKFPGNVTRSYRTRHPMTILEEIDEWEAHPPEVLQSMLENIARLRALGQDVIED